MKSKTLYLSDLDGTLLRSVERLSEYTIDIINSLVKHNGCFSYATARLAVTASKVTTGLLTEAPVICYNGAFTMRKNEIINSNYFTPTEIEYIKSFLGLIPIVYAYVNGKERFSFIENDISEGMQHFLNSRLDDPRRNEAKSVDELYAGDIFYISCISGEQQLEPVNAIINKDQHFQSIYHKDIYSGAQWCEIMPKKATKANAAIQLKSMLHCDKLIVFGDGLNDIPLFNVADECYAMQNAAPELKKIATDVIESNDNDGVAKWIEKNVKRM